MQAGSTGIFTPASITDSSLPQRLRSRRRGGKGWGESIHAEASLKPGRIQGSLSPLEEWMYSPLCFGSGRHFLSGATAAATVYSVHPVLPGPGQAGRCSRRGVSSRHPQGVSFNKRRIPGCWICSSSPSCSFSGANGAQGSPERWAGCQPHTTPSLAQVVFPVLEPEEEAAEGSPGLPPGVPVGAANPSAPTGSPRTRTCVFISPPPM